MPLNWLLVLLCKFCLILFLISSSLFTHSTDTFWLFKLNIVIFKFWQLSHWCNFSNYSFLLISIILISLTLHNLLRFEVFAIYKIMFSRNFRSFLNLLGSCLFWRSLANFILILKLFKIVFICSLIWNITFLNLSLFLCNLSLFLSLIFTLSSFWFVKWRHVSFRQIRR